MLQFDVRVTVKQLDEETQEQEPEFDYTESMAKAMRDYLEYLITNLPYLDGDRVFVFSPTNIGTVP